MNETKTVLLINDHIHFGGGGDAALQFEKRHLENLGFEVICIGFGEEEIIKHPFYVLEIPSNPKIEKLNKFFFSGNIEKKFTELINKIKPDLVHIHLISKFPLSVYNSPALKKVPVIQTLHGPNLFCSTSWGGLKSSGSCELRSGIKCFTRGCTNAASAFLYWQMQEKYWKSLNNTIDLFHCPSLNIFNSAKRLGFKNSTYIPLAIDEIFLEVPIPKKLQRPTLLYVGALAEQKGVQFLLPALKKIKKSFPNILLRLAGRGSLLTKLKRETIELKLEKNIEFVGFVPHGQIREFYLSGDIFVMPSIWQEQFGLVGPEALACEVPCIGSNVGGIPEWLRHNENGFLVPPQEIDPLVDRIIDLLSNDQKRVAFGRNGRKMVLKEYGPKLYQKNIEEMITSLI